jgi:hypothetical protein
MPRYHLATFVSDATPPDGHPLCGGWIEPVRGVDDPLRCFGIVLLGEGKPIVLASLDWVGLRNEAYRGWRAALAAAAHTTPEHVAIHCIHPHNAPFADTEAQKLIAAVNGPISLDLAFFDKTVAASADALKKSLLKTQAFTHVGYGEGLVNEVASNRRVVGPDGKIQFTRTSATRDPVARAAPEGLIDPKLRTLSFWNGDTPLAALHFYTTHPMSYYGDGRVSADFCGLARQKMQDEFPKTVQMYFTGCAGNVTAGKYNDGEKANRMILRDRMYTGMKTAWAATTTHAVTGWTWDIEPMLFAPRREPTFGEEVSTRDLQNEKLGKARRNNCALQLAWLKRIRTPIELYSLAFGTIVQTLHLPGEPFIEYQLATQKFAGMVPTCVAGYGDGGLGYIPTAAAFLEGGYEPTVALAAPETEGALLKAIEKLVK